MHSLSSTTYSEEKEKEAEEEEVEEAPLFVPAPIEMTPPTHEALPTTAVAPALPRYARYRIPSFRYRSYRILTLPFERSEREIKMADASDRSKRREKVPPSLLFLFVPIGAVNYQARNVDHIG